uniref:Uncharacterized protein n=1 Tax=Wuchereria bancrofti TaxID=6293 RepID=A0AAF5PLF4_WUCBA
MEGGLHDKWHLQEFEVMNNSKLYGNISVNTMESLRSTQEIDDSLNTTHDICTINSSTMVEKIGKRMLDSKSRKKT